MYGMYPPCFVCFAYFAKDYITSFHTHHKHYLYKHTGSRGGGFSAYKIQVQLA